MTLVDLLERIHRLHVVGQSPADAEMLSALGQLAPHAEDLAQLLHLGEQVATAMQTVILHHGHRMAPADTLTRNQNADMFLKLLETRV